VVDWGSGFTGTGWLTQWDPGQSVRFTVDRATAGPVELRFQAKASFGPASRSIVVNGATLGRLVFAASEHAGGDWTQWSTARVVPFTVDLPAGRSEITLVRADDVDGPLDLDFLEVAPPPRVRLEAEDARRSRVSVGASLRGFTGSGYASSWRPRGWVSFTVDRPAVGQVVLELRYRATAANARRTLAVGGGTPVTVEFPRTSPMQRGDRAAWDRAAIVRVTVSLPEGRSVLRLARPTWGGGALQLDHVEVVGR
jgi:hypothetical protein